MGDTLGGMTTNHHHARRSRCPSSRRPVEPERRTLTAAEERTDRIGIIILGVVLMAMIVAAAVWGVDVVNPGGHIGN